VIPLQTRNLKQSFFHWPLSESDGCHPFKGTFKLFSTTGTISTVGSNNRGS